MKPILASVGAFVAIAVLFFMFAPDSRVQAVKTEWNRLTSNTGQICFDQYSDQLKDSDSAHILRSYKKSERIYVIYKAKNGFGAYSNGTFDCPLTNGHVDKIKTTIEQTDNLINLLKNQSTQ